LSGCEMEVGGGKEDSKTSDSRNHHVTTATDGLRGRAVLTSGGRM